MNKLRYRVIFSVARGMLIAVQETARSAGKAAGTTAGAIGAGGATFALLAVSPALAQIAGDPSAPGNQRPTVLAAPNGVPVVNIVTPSAAGVSRNAYRQFDVNTQGAILNNSRTAVQSNLGGHIAGNPWLATGPARVILNEVNSSSPSSLRGYVEVAGSKADVIIANPAGIQVQGGGFINSNRVTLTTGVPQFNAYGGIESYRVTGGSIGVSGNGVDFSSTEFAALYARMIEINGGVWGGGELRVVTGANQIAADGAPGVAASVVPITGTGSAQPIAFDAGALGGMYAQKIWIMGSEAGVGARNAGTIQTGAGDAKLMGLGELTVTSAGRIENLGIIQAAGAAFITVPTFTNSGKVVAAGSASIATQGDLTNAGGTIEGQRVELASAAGDLINTQGAIRQTSAAGLTLTAPTLLNTNGGTVGYEPVADSSGASAGAGAGGTGSGSGGSGSSTDGNAAAGSTGGSASPGTSGGSSTDTAGAGSTPAPSAPIAPGAITAAGTIRNEGGHIYSGGPIELQTPNVSNAGGKLEVASLSVSGPAFSNAGGILNVTNGFNANVASFDNSGGKLNAGSVAVATTGDLLNQDGTLASNGDVSLDVGGMVNNQRGAISATGALDAHVAGAIQNASGSLVANRRVTVQGRSLDNTLGTVASATTGTSLSINDALVNSGQINAATDLSVHAGSISNSGTMRGGNDASIAVADALSNDGSITAARNTSVAAASLQGGGASVLGAGINADGSLGTTGDLNVTATDALVAMGTNLAAGDASLQGASVDLSGSQTSAANIAIAATQGDVTTSGATVATSGTLGIHADSQSLQTLVNQGGKLNAGQLDLHASNIDNTNDGEVVQTGRGATTIAVTGSLNNAGGRIASNSQDLTLKAKTLTNTAGKVEHAGTGTLKIEADGVDGANGQITSNGAFVAAVTGDFNQDGGTTTAKQITIDAGSLGNRGGTIVQTGTDATRISVVGAIDNGNGGSIASNGATDITAGSLVNQAGSIRAAGTSDLNITTAGLLDNSAQGEIGAGGNVALGAGSLVNDAGRVTAVGDLAATVVGAASNVGGTLAANNDTTIFAASLDSTRGTIAAVDGDLAVATTGGTKNSSGTMQAGGNVDISNGGFENSAGTEHGVQETAHGRDLGYQKAKDKGTVDQTTNYNQFNAGSLEVNANHVQAGLGARDSLEQLARQPGMGWVDQINNNPSLQGKIDWQRVEEAHQNWNYSQQGLTPEGAAIVTLVATFVTWGVASGAGAAAGNAAAVGAGEGVALSSGGAFLTGTGATISGAVSGAVTAGLSALAGQAAVALANNQGDIGAALHDLGSSANVKNLLTAIATGGALGSLNLNPTGLPTVGGGSQQFMDQLGQNLTAGAAKAVIGTAINGGSFEENLKEGLKNALLDTVAAQGAYAIGDLKLDEFTNKIAHAIAGCAVGAAQTDGSCAAGALGAAIGEMAAEAYGRQADTEQFAAMLSGIAGAIAGLDATQINLASQAGANAAVNNYLAHPEKIRDSDVQARILATGEGCKGAASCSGVAAQAQAQIDLLSDAKLAEICAGNAGCAADRQLERSVYGAARDAAIARLDPNAAASDFLLGQLGRSPYGPTELSAAVTRMQDGRSVANDPIDQYVHTALAANPPLFAAILGISLIDGDGGKGGLSAAASSARNVANAKKLANQLQLEAANSPFEKNGTLTSDAILSAKAVAGLGPGELNNPFIPSGFGKYTTESIRSPAGDFQVHVYKNPNTGEVLYDLDYKAIFNAKSGVPKP